MISLTDFKRRCKTDSAEDIVDSVILTDDALHVSVENREYAAAALGSLFGVKPSEMRLLIVGSAKLGFAITEKKKRDGTLLPRYRSFSPTSDIDAAIVSPRIFRMIWEELCIFAHGKAFIPWDSGPLGDYMIYGWLRPDHFPTLPRVRRCDDWLDVFRKFSAAPRFGRRTVRGGLFYSMGDLRRYQRRSVLECIQQERI